jgi:RimJ/RimL family protein N-acetyltransferase
VAERNFAASLVRLQEHGFGKRWIVVKATGTGVGFTETKHFGHSCDDVSPDEVEIGWMLTPSSWGQGYATEAGRAVRDEAFERLELESIVAVHHSENAASGRVMEKLGMAFERDVVTRDGWPYRLYRLTREQWSGRRCSTSRSSPRNCADQCSVNACETPTRRSRTRLNSR